MAHLSLNFLCSELAGRFLCILSIPELRLVPLPTVLWYTLEKRKHTIKSSKRVKEKKRINKIQ